MLILHYVFLQNSNQELFHISNMQGFHRTKRTNNNINKVHREDILVLSASCRSSCFERDQQDDGSHYLERLMVLLPLFKFQMKMATLELFYLESSVTRRLLCFQATCLEQSVETLHMDENKKIPQDYVFLLLPLLLMYLI